MGPPILNSQFLFSLLYITLITSVASLPFDCREAVTKAAYGGGGGIGGDIKVVNFQISPVVVLE